MPRSLILFALLFLVAFGVRLPLLAQSLTADEVMARVAVNQDQSERLRGEYVYKQNIRVMSRKTNGKLMREETAVYSVLPTPDGMNKQMEQIRGRYLQKGKYVEFAGEPLPQPDSLDSNLIRDFRRELAADWPKATDENRSKDGLSQDLFPLTTKEQKKYRFTLLGEETVQGRPVYRIGFRPNDNDELTWAGEAVIDKEDFQPVVVFTKLSRRIPFAIRALLGTDLPGIGFNVRYQRQPDGVWFPVSLGSEFRLHVLFFLNRDIAISLQNTGFQHTDVKSTIKYEGEPR
jgi:hypothetical protein